MAARKKNQTPAEQNGQDVAQTNTTAEQNGQDVAQTNTTAEQDGQDVAQTNTTAEQNGQDVAQTNTTAEQDGQDVAKTGEAGNNGEDKQNGQEQERDEFADIPNPCVYCGPTVRGVARQYTTYQGGIPNELKEFIKEHPAVRRLIIPTSKFAAVRKRMETQGTAEALIYKKVKSELR